VSSLSGLTRKQRRRAYITTAIRASIGIALIIVVYSVLPWDSYHGDALSLVRVACGFALFGVIVALQVRKIGSARIPELHAAETLAIALPLFLVLCAGFYLSMSHANVNSFSVPLDRVSAIYFTVVTFGTVGFGDITPTTDIARLAVTVQILIDLAFLTLLIRVIVNAARSAVAARDESADGDQALAEADEELSDPSNFGVQPGPAVGPL
jgi:voltage-gated potassium channel